MCMWKSFTIIFAQQGEELECDFGTEQRYEVTWVNSSVVKCSGITVRSFRQYLTVAFMIPRPNPIIAYSCSYCIYWLYIISYRGAKWFGRHSQTLSLRHDAQPGSLMPATFSAPIAFHQSQESDFPPQPEEEEILQRTWRGYICRQPPTCERCVSCEGMQIINTLQLFCICIIITPEKQN